MNELRGQKVKVYWNIHKQCFSVKHGKDAIRHASNLMLADVKFIVNEAGRQRVLAEKCKNVHAFVCGILLEADFENLCETDGFDRVSYNPYKTDKFYHVETGLAVETAKTALLVNGTVWID